MGRASRFDFYENKDAGRGFCNNIYFRSSVSPIGSQNLVFFSLQIIDGQAFPPFAPKGLFAHDYHNFITTNKVKDKGIAVSLPAVLK